MGADGGIIVFNSELVSEIVSKHAQIREKCMDILGRQLSWRTGYSREYTIESIGAIDDDKSEVSDVSQFLKYWHRHAASCDCPTMLNNSMVFSWGTNISETHEALVEAIRSVVDYGYYIQTWT